MPRRLSPAEEKLLHRFVERLLAIVPVGIVRAVVVFGSRARGGSNERSDLDVAVEIAPEADVLALRHLASGVADGVMSEMDAYGLGLSVLVLPPGPPTGVRGAIQRDGIRVWSWEAAA
ncbi:MAG TPA: nucleotidyltransferase domain-containing protein [Acetobacteraceae bacterium]|nr:nucleotidyltransferase domain-containing protein [Acetobacteraceae bacterium]